MDDDYVVVDDWLIVMMMTRTILLMIKVEDDDDDADKDDIIDDPGGRVRGRARCVRSQRLLHSALSGGARLHHSCHHHRHYHHCHYHHRHHARHDPPDHREGEPAKLTTEHSPATARRVGVAVSVKTGG